MAYRIEGERGDKIRQLAAEGRTFAEICSRIMANPASIKKFIKDNNLPVEFVPRQKLEVYR